MKTISLYIKTLCLLFVLSFSVPVQAQLFKKSVTHGVARNMAKKTVKSGIRKSVRKNAVHSATKRLTTRSIENSLKRKGRKMTGDIMTHGATSHRMVKSVAGKSGKKSARNLAMKSNRKGASSATTSTIGGKGGKSISSVQPKSLKDHSVRLTEYTVHKYSPASIARRVSPTKTASHTVSGVQTSAQSPLSDIFGKRGLAEWQRVSGGNAAATQKLARDLAENPGLASALKQNPALLGSYHQMGGSVYRKDVTMLRYIHNNADQARLHMFIQGPRKAKVIKAENLSIADKGGKTLITDKVTGQQLATIQGDVKNGYTVVLNEKLPDNPVGNLTPLANATYIDGPMVHKTDRYGRVVESRCRIQGKVAEAERDGDMIGRIKCQKADYDVKGNQIERTGMYEKEDGGHMIANSWGGKSSTLNIFPQNAETNRHSIWKTSEGRGLKMAKKGHKVERIIHFEYGDRMSQRPTSYTLTQLVDGQPHVIDDVVLERYKFDNARILKKP